MKKLLYFITLCLIIGFAGPALAAGGGGNGYMGGGGDLETPPEETPPTEGPLDDHGSDKGSLYGDLFVIQRWLGGETKAVPAVDENGDPVLVLGDWIDADGNVVTDDQGNPYQVWQQDWSTAPAVGGEPTLSEGFGMYTIVNEDTGEYVINPMTGDIYYPAPYPSQCPQPVASVDVWGDISSKTGLEDNLLPLIITYDSTWERTECGVTTDIFLTAGETWNGVTYYTDILFSDLIQEVSFGRLNLGRAPEAVLDHAYDEAIRMINNAIQIELDASGRLLLTSNVYDEFLTNPDGTPVLLDTVTKAIDSPLENLSLYIKLMNDGHLITAAPERTPIDRSVQGGIPIWKLLELEDGPSSALRPTIDIAHVQSFGLGNLVDASNVTTYYTYRDAEGNLVVLTDNTTCVEPIVCEEWIGITEQSDLDVCAGADFANAATFVSSAADKTGVMTIDKVVYLNSILGINLVVGHSAYDENDEPLPDSIDYAANPIYFNFGLNMDTYDRAATFANRGQVVTPAGEGSAGTYDGNVRLLVEDPLILGTWVETVLPIMPTIFADVNITGDDITGFTAMADDDLGVIEFTHTYQIPGLR